MRFSKLQLVCFLFISFLGISIPCEASKVSREIKKGKKLYSDENYMGALERFENALAEEENSDIVNFNVGTAKYKNHEFEDAILYFQKALLGEDEDIKQKTYYNLGNSLYKFGIEKEEINPETTVKALEESVKGFEKALEIDAEDVDAKTNYSFVVKEIERVKEKLQQQQSKPCPFPKDKKENDKDDQSEEKNEKQQNSQDFQDSQDSQQQDGKSQEQSQEQQDKKEQSQGQEQDEQQQEQSSQSSGEEEGDDENQSQSSGDDDGMSEEQARMMLRSYQQSEEPKGMLNLGKQNIPYRDVDKDW